MDVTFLADDGFGLLSVDNILTGAAVGATYLLSRLIAAWRSKLQRQEVQTERDRLLIEVLGPVRRRPTASDGGSSPPVDEEVLTSEEPDTKFAKLLIEYYAYGLTQARRSFSVSLTCSTLGGLVLIAGVGMAIFRADTTGEQYASVTASVSGLLTAAIGTLFHKRADAALRHMETQSQSLQQDMKVERDAGQAIKLLESVKDPGLKAHLQAALILKFSAATLPELNGVLKSAEALPDPSLNGALPKQQPESATS